MRPSGKLKRFMSNADYQVSTKRTKKKNSPSVSLSWRKADCFVEGGL
jgi:hypothetical protein